MSASPTRKRWTAAVESRSSQNATDCVKPAFSTRLRASWRTDWLHVEDHARALDLVVSAGAVGESYNIGGREERTNLQVVEAIRSEEHTSELQSLLRISYAVFCWKKKNKS